MNPVVEVENCSIRGSMGNVIMWLMIKQQLRQCRHKSSGNSTLRRRWCWHSFSRSLLSLMTASWLPCTMLHYDWTEESALSNPCGNCQPMTAGDREGWAITMERHANTHTHTKIVVDKLDTSVSVFVFKYHGEQIISILMLFDFIGTILQTDALSCLTVMSW